MTITRKTIARDASLTGVGLFSGQPVTIRCFPAPPGAGVRFLRTDLPGTPEIPASVEFTPGQPSRCTALRHNDSEVRMVEHILAALAGLGITDLKIELDAEEIPAADGSALPFVRLFQSAGIIEHGSGRPIFVVTEPLQVSDKEARLLALPHEHGLRISYTLDYGELYFRTQSFTFDFAENTFIEQLAPARTFVLRSEIEWLRAKGLGKGATTENVLVVEENGSYANPSRFPDECARHKILDLLGDLYLAQCAIQARIVGHRSGHLANVALARLIRQAYLRGYAKSSSPPFPPSTSPHSPSTC